VVVAAPAALHEDLSWHGGKRPPVWRDSSIVVSAKSGRESFIIVVEENIRDTLAKS